jgi:hypothetical protein
MQYIMMPLDAHYDSGFGAIADAFHGSALTLKTDKPSFFEHLPQNFLFRHAIELYLKSGIVILHRKLKLPFGTQPYNAEPMVLTGGEWKPIRTVHSIGALYSHWKETMEPRAEELKALCKHETDWVPPPEMSKWIELVEATDPKSTYFRYPSTRDPKEDQAKSPFKEIGARGLVAAEGKFIKALVIENEDREFVRGYVLDEDSEKESNAALMELSNLLYCFHAMMRMELTGGF